MKKFEILVKRIVERISSSAKKFEKSRTMQNDEYYSHDEVHMTTVR